MESAYVDELKASINLLMANLESLPVTKGSGAESKYSLQKFKRYNKLVLSSCSAMYCVVLYYDPMRTLAHSDPVLDLLSAMHGRRSNTVR